MMKKLELKPDGFMCKLSECPPGFFLKGEEVCFKSEYFTENRPDAFCESGEYFWGGEEGKSGVEKVMVQPLVTEWIED